MTSIITDVEDLDTERKYTEDQKGARTYTTRHLITVNQVVWQTRSTENDDWENATAAEYTAETDPALKQILSSIPDWLLLNDSSMPQPHITALTTDPLAKCRTRQLTPWENPFQWYCRITWTTHRGEETEDQDPFARAITGSIRCVDKSVPAFEDSRGMLARTTAGDLYKGLTKIVNIEIIEVTLYSQEYPFSLRSMNNTVNADKVEMFGEDYNPRTLWMKNLRLPKKPTEQWGTLLWETNFELHHDASGYYELLPNAGVHELQYWTRAATDEKWVAVDFAAYTAESDTDLKTITRERIQTGSAQSVGGDTWLNEHGEGIVPSLLQPAATASVTTGSKTVTLTGGTIDETYLGTMATILYSNFNGIQQSVKVRIDTVGGSGTSFNTTQTIGLTASGLSITFAGGGAMFNYLEMQTGVVWGTAVPLPEVPPDLGNVS